MEKEDIINRQDKAPSDYHLFGTMKEGLRDKQSCFILAEKWGFIILFTQPLRSGSIWHKVNF